jgi:hypothetical protein
MTGLRRRRRCTDGKDHGENPREPFHCVTSFLKHFRTSGDALIEQILRAAGENASPSPLCRARRPRADLRKPEP